MVIDELRKRGFKNTAVIDEGILVWKQKGYPMKTAELKPEAAAAGATGHQAPQAAPPPPEDHTGHNHN
jgi:3-mercaptopyruvate sulfurtransferase SseA